MPAVAAGRVQFLDLAFDAMGVPDVLAWIARRGPDASLAYVVTPNVDHMVRLARLSGDLRRAYESADLCLCDSRILQRLARLAGIRLRLAAGSDLTAALLEEGLDPGDRVCLIGGRPGQVERLRARYPKLVIVQHVPPMGLLHDAPARAAAIAAAAAAEARIVLLAVGSPQQELLAYEMRRGGKVTGTALCIGASIDFLTGSERRAPRLVQRLGVEWAWRLGANPRRMAKRYLVDCPAIFPMVLGWRRRRGRRR